MKKKRLGKSRGATRFVSGQKLLFLLTLLCAIGSVSPLFSCTVKSKDPLIYKENGFSARVRATGGELEFEGIFHIPASEKDFSLELLAPESLRGLSLSLSDGEMKLALGEKVFLTERTELLSSLQIGKIAEMLAPEGAIRSIKSEGGLTAVSVGDVTVYINPENSIPVRIEDRSTGITLTVLEFWQEDM